MFIRTQSNGSRTYLLLVDNERVDGKVTQRVLFRLGRLDQLLASGQLDSLIQSLGRFSEKLAILGAHARGDSISTRSARIGPALIFERLWQGSSIDKLLTSLLKGRRFEFSVERAIFLTVLHRLFAPGSDRGAEKWKDDYTIEGVADLELHHLDRAMAWLGEVLPGTEQDGATPLSPRTNKDLLEEALHARRGDLFNDLDLVFFDTTSIYLEGEGGASIGQLGYLKDHRPELKQMVVGMVLDGKGNQGVANLVSQLSGAIGYVELTYALQNHVSVGELQNAGGNWVKPTIDGVSEAAASVKEIPADFRVSITNATGANAWPIASFTWILAPLRPSSAAKSKLLKDLLSWIVTSGQNDAGSFSYAPLPAPIVEKALKAIASLP